MHYTVVHEQDEQIRGLQLAPYTELKAELEAAAAREEPTSPAILDRLVREWLAKRPRADAEEDAEQQRRLHERA